MVKLKLASYNSQILTWPPTGLHILAQYDDDNIIVYQAYNEKIAKSIIECQNFHSDLCHKSGYNMNRMSWIKTNFLWMMFRSGWASKPNQERILAIKVTRNGFEEILKKAVRSSSSTVQTDRISATDEVRLQWDPDHAPDGSKVNSGRRAIQLGLRGDALLRFSKEFIVEINDITEFVLEQSKNISNLNDLLIPLENVYFVSDSEISKRIY